MQNTGKYQLGLGDPYNNSEVRQRTDWLTSPSNTDNFLNGEIAGDFPPSSYAIESDPVGAHVAVMDQSDTYVSVITTLNGWFGSKVMTSGGILMNNAVANFYLDSVPLQDTENKLLVGKRPLSTSVVALAGDTKNLCGQRIILGGARPDSVGEVLADALIFGIDLRYAVDRKRILVSPNGRNISVEDVNFAPSGDIDKNLIDKFIQSSTNSVKLEELPFTTVNVLEKNVDITFEIADPRSGSQGELQDIALVI